MSRSATKLSRFSAKKGKVTPTVNLIGIGCILIIVQSQRSNYPHTYTKIHPFSAELLRYNRKYVRGFPYFEFHRWSTLTIAQLYVSHCPYTHQIWWRFVHPRPSYRELHQKVCGGPDAKFDPGRVYRVGQKSDTSRTLYSIVWEVSLFLAHPVCWPLHIVRNLIPHVHTKFGEKFIDLRPSYCDITEKNVWGSAPLLNFTGVHPDHFLAPGTPLCTSLQNLREIGRSAAELQPFKHYQFWRHPPSWILPEVDFDLCTTSVVPRCISLPGFSAIERCAAELLRFY